MSDVRDEMTERLLADAGVTAGMRVLDVGCGRGDVTLMAARRVGPAGSVLGVDRDPQPLAVARSRARDLGLSNVAFAEADLAAEGEVGGEVGGVGPFDAVVGRRVLMYLPDPVGVLRQVTRLLRPGGLVVVQEHDATMTPASRVPLPLHGRVHDWIWRTVEREGANPHVGFDLRSLCRASGLAVAGLRAEAVVQTPETEYPHWPTSSTCHAPPHRGARGPRRSTEAEVDVDTARRPPGGGTAVPSWRGREWRAAFTAPPAGDGPGGHPGFVSSTAHGVRHLGHQARWGWT